MILGALSSSSLFFLSNLMSWRNTEYLLLIPQVLCCVGVEPDPQVLAASRMEEKDPANCCCRAYRFTSLFLSSMLDISGAPFRYPNSPFEYLRPRREMGTESPCLGCGSN
jgi:hypothetical protein